MDLMTIAKHIAADLLKRVLNGLGSLVHKNTHSVGHHNFVGLVEVLFLETFTENTCNAIANSILVTLEDVIGCGRNELGQELELHHSLFNIVGDGQVIEPVFVHFLVHLGAACLNPVALELKHLTEGSDSIVTCVVELIGLHLFLSNFSAHLEIDRSAETREAQLRVGSKGCSTVLSNHTNTVARSLTKGGASVSNKAAHFLHNHTVVFLGEVGRAKVLNHVVEDEKTELVAFLVVASEGLHEHF